MWPGASIGESKIGIVLPLSGIKEARILVMPQACSSPRLSRSAAYLKMSQIHCPDSLKVGRVPPLVADGKVEQVSCASTLLAMARPHIFSIDK